MSYLCVLGVLCGEFFLAGWIPASAAVLTPKSAPAPRINGPTVYGCRPGRPFLYRIPSTGRRPMRFTAANLPPSLRLDPDTGIIAGRAPEERGAESSAPPRGAISSRS